MIVTYAEKLNKLEIEIIKLKKNVKIIPKSPLSLKGILKGLNITDKDIKQARRSLFKGIKI